MKTSLKSPEDPSRRGLVLAVGAVSFAVLALGLSALQPARAQEVAASLEGNPITQLIPAELQNAEGETVSRDSLSGKFVGVYFSAHWCPPCQLFTPKLTKFYKKHQDEFEIVFVSSDHGPDEKTTYLEEAGMKWLTVPGQSNSQTQKMGGMLGVRGIPTLAIFDPQGRLLTTEGRQFVESSPNRAMKMWKDASESAEE